MIKLLNHIKMDENVVILFKSQTLNINKKKPNEDGGFLM